MEALAGRRADRGYLDQTEPRNSRVAGEPIERSRERSPHPRDPRSVSDQSSLYPRLEMIEQDRLGSQHTSASVIEEFVEALPPDPRLAEDVRHGCRLVAI